VAAATHSARVGGRTPPHLVACAGSQRWSTLRLRDNEQTRAPFIRMRNSDTAPSRCRPPKNFPLQRKKKKKKKRKKQQQQNEDQQRTDDIKPT
jgi:hypothetical protein